MLGFPSILIPSRYISTGVVCPNTKWKGNAKRLMEFVNEHIDENGDIIHDPRNLDPWASPTRSPTLPPAQYTGGTGMSGKTSNRPEGFDDFVRVLVPRFVLNDTDLDDGTTEQAVLGCPNLQASVVRNKASFDCGPEPLRTRDIYRCDYWNLTAACEGDQVCI